MIYRDKNIDSNPTPSITIVGVDSDPFSQDLTRNAIIKTMECINIQEILYFGVKELGLGENFIKIDRFNSINDYSHYFLNNIAPHIKTDFILTLHWDGFALNPSSWSDEFFKYDYIGALWPWETDHMRVGNGGFSFRSKKLLDACIYISQNIHTNIKVSGPEDVIIGRLYRPHLENLGCKFAPDEIAEQFSHENGTINATPFGFHGPMNFPIFLSEEDILKMLPDLKNKMKPGVVFDQFIDRCLLQGYNKVVNAFQID